VNDGRCPDPRWADLADLALIIARELQFRGYADQQAIALTQSEGMVMRFLLAHPDTVPSRIADATGLQRTNLSAVLRGLESEGLIERHASAEDRRGVTVRATERGKSNYALVRQEWARAVSAAAGGEPRTLDTTLALLRAVEAGLATSRPAAPGRPSTLL